MNGRGVNAINFGGRRRRRPPLPTQFTTEYLYAALMPNQPSVGPPSAEYMARKTAPLGSEKVRNILHGYEMAAAGDVGDVAGVDDYVVRFERIVVVKLDGLKTLFSTLALFVSIAFPVFLEFADYLDEDHAYMLRVFVSTGIVIAGIALIFSDKLVMRTQARFVDKVLAKQVANFVSQLRGAIPILDLYPKNFLLKPIHEVTAALKEKAGVEDDDSSLQDEYRVLNELNDGLKLLRENTFRLSDLKSFYDIKQVIVFENMPWTGACTRILDAIEDPRSKLIGRIVRENDLGYFQVNEMKDILKDFAKVVLTGSGHPREAKLDEWMNESLEKTTGVQPDPGLVILYRVHCAMIDELYTHGTTLIAKTLQIITAEDACSCFEFQFLENTPEVPAQGETGPDGAITGHVAAVPAKTYTIDDPAVDIVNSTFNLKLANGAIVMKGGFSPDYGADTRATEVRGRGLLITRCYFRVKYGVSLGLFGVDSKDGLLGLVRSDDNMMKAPTDRLGDQFYAKIDRSKDEKKAMERLVLPSSLARGA